MPALTVTRDSALLRTFNDQFYFHALGNGVADFRNWNTLLGFALLVAVTKTAALLLTPRTMVAESFLLALS